MKIATMPMVIALVALPAAARAQQPEQGSWFRDRLPVPVNALELTIGSGYTQGLGLVRGSTSLPSIASAGVGVDLGVGARISQRVSLGVVGQYHQLIGGSGDVFTSDPSVFGLTTGIALTYHMAAQERFDPWVELGAGYRMLWRDANQPGTPSVLTHGLQIARVRVGADLRATIPVALGPVFGVDVNTFLWEDTNTSSAINDVRLSAFVFAGIQGRIDIGGTVVGGTTLSSAEVIGRR